MEKLTVKKFLFSAIYVAFRAAVTVGALWLLFASASPVWAGMALAASTHGTYLATMVASLLVGSAGYAVWTVAEVIHFALNRNLKDKRHIKEVNHTTGVITMMNGAEMHFREGDRIQVSSFDGYESE